MGDANDNKVMEDALARLIEQFDCVQIFATRRDSEGTENFSIGSGDYFARFGIARQWVIAEEEKAKDLASSESISRWLDEALDVGIDPL